MKLKRKLTNEEFTGLPDGVKECYVENTSRSGEYLLDVEDDGGLKRALDAEKKARTIADARVTELEGDVESLNTQLTAAKPDVAKLEATYRDKEKGMKTAHETALKGERERFANILAEQQATSLAMEISTAPDLVVDALKKRLKVTIDDDGKHSVEILDGSGLASSASLEDLGKEFVANTKYAAIMKGSSASGSSASQPRGGSSASNWKGKAFGDTNDAERVAWHKDDPAGFEAAKNSHQQAQKKY